MVKHLRGLGNHRGRSWPSPRIAGCDSAAMLDRDRRGSTTPPSGPSAFAALRTFVIACRICEVVADGEDYLRKIHHGALLRLAHPRPAWAPIHIEIPIAEHMSMAGGVVSWCHTPRQRGVLRRRCALRGAGDRVRRAQGRAGVPRRTRHWQIVRTQERAMSSEQAAPEWILRHAAGFPRYAQSLPSTRSTQRRRAWLK
jgi:hypothetical protein